MSAETQVNSEPFYRVRFPQVIGGGPLGCEPAQAFSRLGSHVTIVQNDPKFLPREERDAAEILSRSMARDGVEIRLNTAVVGARSKDGNNILETMSDGTKGSIEADEILLSVGRVPNVEELNLDAAGVAFDTENGIKVDDFLRSSNSDICGRRCLPRFEIHKFCPNLSVHGR